MIRLILGLLTAIALFTGPASAAADITGRWTASFATQVGQQNYTYEFKVQGVALTGTAKSNLSESPLYEGKVDGETVTFKEILKFNGNEVPVRYTGRIVSESEIRFTRAVGRAIPPIIEEMVAKRFGKK